MLMPEDFTIEEMSLPQINQRLKPLGIRLECQNGSDGNPRFHAIEDVAALFECVIEDSFAIKDLALLSDPTRFRSALDAQYGTGVTHPWGR